MPKMQSLLSPVAALLLAVAAVGAQAQSTLGFDSAGVQEASAASFCMNNDSKRVYQVAE